jgi:tetratricopeptide (TPR) repeat protein
VLQSVIARSREILRGGDPDAATRAELVWQDYLPNAPAADLSCCWSNIAELLAMQGRTQEACEVFEKSLPLALTGDDQLRTLVGHADAVAQGALKSSVPAVLRALLELRPHFPNLAGSVWGYVSISRLALFLGDHGSAESEAQAAIGACDRSQSHGGAAEAYSALSAALERKGDLVGAVEALESAMCYMSEGHCLMAGRIRYAQLSRLSGDYGEAERSLAEALRFPDWRDRRVVASALREIANLVDVRPETAHRALLLMAARVDGGEGG